LQPNIANNKEVSMKNPKWLLIAVLLASLVLTVAACGASEPTAAPAPTNTPIPPTDTPAPPTDTPVPPTDTPEPTDTPIPPTETPEPVEETGEELDLGALAMPTDLTSYRMQMLMRVNGMEAGEEVSMVLDMSMEFTSEPPAQHALISMEGVEGAEEFGNIEMYIVEDTMYMRLGEDWMSLPAEGDPLSDIGAFSSDEMLADTCGWHRLEDTEVNDIQVQHWTFDKQDLEACATALQLEDLGELSEARGDLYIAAEENYLVRMEMVLEGNNMASALEEEGTLDEARIEILMDLSDINEPFTIELPEEAMGSGSGLPEDIPLIADAEEVTSLMGFITFMSPSTPEEVTDFYKIEMANNGWSEVSAEEMAGMFLLEYLKDGRTASLMISEDSETGKTSVLITIVEE
jgi:hypothetical protein